MMLRTHKNLEKEFSFRTSRSSGAGGQHVNTTETKVELIFHIKNSAFLNAEEKERLLKKWAKRINDEGEFRISSSQHRSQSANKEHVIKKFFSMLEKGLKKEKKRIPTTIPEEVKTELRKKKEIQSKKKSERRFQPKDYL